MKKLATILSPCILALSFCLIALIIEGVELIKGEAFADVFFVTFLFLALMVFLLDIITKKVTKYRAAYFWPTQMLLLIGLFFLTRLVVGGMFSGFV